MAARLPSVEARPCRCPPACLSRLPFPACCLESASLSGLTPEDGLLLILCSQLVPSRSGLRGSSLFIRRPRGLVELWSSGTRKRGGQRSNLRPAVCSLQGPGRGLGGSGAPCRGLHVPRFARAAGAREKFLPKLAVRIERVCPFQVLLGAGRVVPGVLPSCRDGRECRRHHRLSSGARRSQLPWLGAGAQRASACDWSLVLTCFPCFLGTGVACLWGGLGAALDVCGFWWPSLGPPRLPPAWTRPTRMVAPGDRLCVGLRPLPAELWAGERWGWGFRSSAWQKRTRKSEVSGSFRG